MAARLHWAALLLASRTASGGVEVVVPCRISDFEATLNFLQARCGLALDEIFPADAPREARLSEHQNDGSSSGLALRLVAHGEHAPAEAREIRVPLSADDPLVGTSEPAPNGMVVSWRAAAVDAAVGTPGRARRLPLSLPPLRSAGVVLSRAGEGAEGKGRAGMLYRDLVPCRLGGALIASAIQIPSGGPVPDYVHYHLVRPGGRVCLGLVRRHPPVLRHTPPHRALARRPAPPRAQVRFQMIYCVRGWVRVVYEGETTPFVLSAGDLVLQPPTIRHQVLESSDGLEVIELGVPAEHVTRADPCLELPTGVTSAEPPSSELPTTSRSHGEVGGSGASYGGQRFCHFIAAAVTEDSWEADGDGLQWREAGIKAATDGLARVAFGKLSSASGRATGQRRAQPFPVAFLRVNRGACTLRLWGGLDDDGRQKEGAASAASVGAADGAGRAGMSAVATAAETEMASVRQQDGRAHGVSVATSTARPTEDTLNLHAGDTLTLPSGHAWALDHPTDDLELMLVELREYAE